MKSGALNQDAAQGPKPTPCPSTTHSNEQDMAAIAGGVGLADSALSTADRLTQNLRVPASVDLGAIRVVGGATTVGSFVFSGASLVSNWKVGNWVGVAVNTVDLAAPVVAVLFPPAAPVVIAYGLGRTAGDIGVALAETPSVATCHAL